MEQVARGPPHVLARWAYFGPGGSPAPSAMRMPPMREHALQQATTARNHSKPLALSPVWRRLPWDQMKGRRAALRCQACAGRRCLAFAQGHSNTCLLRITWPHTRRRAPSFGWMPPAHCGCTTCGCHWDGWRPHQPKKSRQAGPGLLQGS